MKLPIGRSAPRTGPNLTPLIDVIFLLIIFFLAASHFSRAEPEEAVVLPIAEPQSLADPALPRRITVTVQAGPRYSVSGRELTRGEVERLIAQAAGEESPQELRIRTDRDIPFGAIEPLLVAAAKAGLRDVRFAVLPR